MELTTRKFNLKLDGVAYELSYPTISRIKSLDPKDIGITEVCDLVESCGLPREIIENLQADHLNMIVEGLMGKNKKS
jgi:hypothetical protein